MVVGAGSCGLSGGGGAWAVTGGVARARAGGWWGGEVGAGAAGDEGRPWDDG